jgi:hypothetical protein
LQNAVFIVSWLFDEALRLTDVGSNFQTGIRMNGPQMQKPHHPTQKANKNNM